MVKRNLAKVETAGSSPVVRSIITPLRAGFLVFKPLSHADSVVLIYVPYSWLSVFFAFVFAFTGVSASWNAMES